MSNLPVSKPGVLDIAPYVPGKSSAAGGKASNATGRAIKLSSNESPLGPSEKALEAFHAAAGSLHRYPEGSAAILREAIGERYGLDPARIVCGAGSDELIGLLVRAYAGVGDEVLYPEHGFLMYKIYTQMAGATPVTAPEKNLATCVDSLLAAVTPKTKIVFLANPNNPTGTYISANEMARLREGLPSHVILGIDGAYAEYVEKDDYTTGQELVDHHENTVMLRTFSKLHGLSALRVGWGYMPPAIADVINRVRSPFNVNTPAMQAATASIRDIAFQEHAISHNHIWLPWLCEQLEALGLIPVNGVANFALVKCQKEGPKSAPEISRHLMEHGIYVREVAGYGLPEYLRITVGTEEENRALIECLTPYMTA